MVILNVFFSLNDQKMNKISDYVECSDFKVVTSDLAHVFNSTWTDDKNSV